MADARAGLDAAARILSEVINESARGIGAQETLDIVGVVLVNEIKIQLSQAGAGRVYGRHQASAPGDPPAVDTGQLRNSIISETGEDSLGPYVDVGSNLEKAEWLEFGTSNMEARPFMRPAVELAVDQMADALAAGIVEAQRQAIARMPKTIVLE